MNNDLPMGINYYFGVRYVINTILNVLPILFKNKSIYVLLIMIKESIYNLYVPPIKITKIRPCL
jgi:hypothetical protein